MWGWLFGNSKRNTRFTSKETIVNQMNEPRPLPMGRKEFEEWSDRIISGALVPGATVESQKWVLANMLLHVDPAQSHKPDAFFIHSLRKNAVNEVAIAMREEIREAQKARKAKEEEEKKLRLVEPPQTGDLLPAPSVSNEAQVLADKSV